MASKLAQTVTAVLSKKGGDFAAVFRALHTPQALTVAELPKPELPKVVNVNDVQAAALAAFPALVNAYKAPTARRKLTKPEREQLNELVPVLRVVEALTKTVRESVRVTFLNHGDVVAEGERTVDPSVTARDGKGHYLIADEDDFAIQGVKVKLNRKLTPPSVGLSSDALQALVVDIDPGQAVPNDKLTHKDYLAMTRPARVLDMDLVTEWVRKNPERMEALQSAAQFTGGSVALTEAKNES